jgi:hypothetical protein
MSHCLLTGYSQFLPGLKIGEIRAIPGPKNGTWGTQAQCVLWGTPGEADLEQADAILFLREPFFVSYSDWGACA